MALLRQFYTNFTSGELTPLFTARVDANAYKNGVKDLERTTVFCHRAVFVVEVAFAIYKL